MGKFGDTILQSALDPNGQFIGMAKGGDIASASPLVIDTDGDYFDVTGTTGFAAMAVAANRHFFLQFDGVLIMTHHGTNLDLPGEANITTAAGDVAEFFSTGSNTVQCVNYTRAAGIASDTAYDATSWNGNTDAATKNAIRDKFETMLPIARYNTLYIDAGAMIPCTTSGAASSTQEYATNDIDLDVMAFDTGATEERVQFKVVMPEQWDNGTVKVKFYWTNAAGATAADTVEWGIKAGALSNDDPIDAALGTAVTISDTLIAAGDLHITAATAAMTIAGTPATGDLIVFEVYRNTDGTDDMVEDAWLTGVLIQYAENNNPAGW